jgi:hypothetical protein
MVEAGVAIKLEGEIMLDIDGNHVFDKEKMYGRPTMYVLTKPENVLFVNETGCNTNQKEDGHVGGCHFILPTCAFGGGWVGAAIDIHFTVLCFTAATGEPVMCAIILKSTRTFRI